MKKTMIVLAAFAAVFFTGCVSMGDGRVTLPDGAVLLDARGVDEFNKEHICGAVSLPHDQVDARIATIVPLKTTPVFVYCRSGKRAGIVIEKMKALGYMDLVNLGGIEKAKTRIK